MPNTYYIKKKIVQIVLIGQATFPKAYCVYRQLSWTRGLMAHVFILLPRKQLFKSLIYCMLGLHQHLFSEIG